MLDEMKLQQLYYALEVVKSGNHISAAADTLHTSQPHVSKQIQRLEAELGFTIFTRKKNRVIGLTDPGKEFIEIARRILADTENLRHIRDNYFGKDSGSLTIATTHTQARYILPQAIRRFVSRYPDIRLGLRQASPTQICELVESGEADIAIGTETSRSFPNLVMLPCYELTRSVVVPVGHPLLQAKKPTLRELAKYPIITYDPAFAGHWKVMSAFEKAGIKPNIVFSAIDADVSKIYVELGLGVAILAAVTFNRRHDINLRSIDASHLFEASTTYVSLRRNTYPRGYILDFIKSFAAQLTPELVRVALIGGTAGVTARRVSGRSTY